MAKLSIITLIFVYLLVFIGGIVRSTGSGMGCPDWPKCFGSWIPPTDSSDLPSNYQEYFLKKRNAKIVRLSSYLNFLGFHSLSNKFKNISDSQEVHNFNFFNTWVEYFNRLFGVLVGLIISVLLAVSSYQYKRNPTLFYFALGTFLATLLQGVIGSVVVTSNLIPFMVTIHMLLALVIVALLIFIVIKSNYYLHTRILNIKNLRISLVFGMMVMIVQIIFGSQVRELVDYYCQSTTANCMSNLGAIFIIHRSFSWIVLISNLIIFYFIYKNRTVNIFAKYLIVTTVISMLSGLSIAVFGINNLLQPIHLLLAFAGFGLQFFLFLQFKKSTVIIN